MAKKRADAVCLGTDHSGCFTFLVQTGAGCWSVAQVAVCLCGTLFLCVVVYLYRDSAATDTLGGDAIEEGEGKGNIREGSSRKQTVDFTILSLSLSRFPSATVCFTTALLLIRCSPLSFFFPSVVFSSSERSMCSA